MFTLVANQVILLILVVIKDMELDYIDYISAFLNRKLDSDIYLKQLESFTINNQYCLLNKSLYRLC